MRGREPDRAPNRVHHHSTGPTPPPQVRQGAAGSIGRRFRLCCPLAPLGHAQCCSVDICVARLQLPVCFSSETSVTCQHKVDGGSLSAPRGWPSRAPANRARPCLVGLAACPRATCRARIRRPPAAQRLQSSQSRESCPDWRRYHSFCRTSQLQRPEISDNVRKENGLAPLGGTNRRGKSWDSQTGAQPLRRGQGTRVVPVQKAPGREDRPARKVRFGVSPADCRRHYTSNKQTLVHKKSRANGRNDAHEMLPYALRPSMETNAASSRVLSAARILKTNASIPARNCMAR